MWARWVNESATAEDAVDLDTTTFRRLWFLALWIQLGALDPTKQELVPRMNASLIEAGGKRGL
jgi:hypothetical protein